MLDLEATRARLAYDDSLLRDMVQFFFEDGTQLLTEIREAVSTEHWGDVERAAHSMKGLAANFGAPSTVEAARRLETAAREKAIDRIPAARDQLEAETEQLMEALRLWCRQVG